MVPASASSSLTGHAAERPAVRPRGWRVPVRVVLLAVLAAIGALGLAGPLAIPPPVLGAAPGLTVVGATRYEAQPDVGRILVTVDLTVTNEFADTSAKQYFYDQAFLAVPPGAASFAVSGGLGRPNWTISEQKPTYTLLSIAFGGRLGAGASTRLRLTFEIPDPGNPPDRDVRVARTLITFPVWALASTGTPGSTVIVSVPADYRVTFLRGTIPGPTTDSAGNHVWTSGPIADPLKFDLFVRADRPLVFTQAKRNVTVGGGTASFIFRAWIDDSAWLSRVDDLYQRGVPRLAAAIGRPWPLQATLTVEEVLNAPTEGIAGSFDPSSRRIEVIYNSGAEVALHEAAHVWFNGGFLADRWANEAFASYYAELVAGELDVPFDPALITKELQAAAMPLNAWAAGSAAPPAGAERSAAEAYGYAASAELARRIAERAGPAGLQRAWSAIDNGTAPYQPPGGPPERMTGPPDWRGLLDVLEDDGTTHVASLWVSYVVRPEEASQLGIRTLARRAYARALEAAGDWSLPRTVRDAMRSWQFDVAGQQLALATSVLDKRDALAASAALAGLTLPTTLRTQFEGATDLALVKAEADAEETAVAAIRAAILARPAEVGPVEWIGLLGSRPDRLLEDASAALRAGDPGEATSDAARAQASWQTAGEAGRLRVAVIAVILVVVLLVGLVIRLLWNRAMPA